MSRQNPEVEIQLALKRPRQEDRLAQCSSKCSIPRSIDLNARTFDMLPFIRGFQDMQDGCLLMVAQQATQGRLRQEQLAQTVARCAAMPSQQYYREAQLEQVRAERDNHFIQEEEALARMRLLSSEAKDWKSRVADIPEHHQVIHQHLTLNVQLIHGHLWTGPESHCRSSSFPPTTSHAVSSTCSRCSKTGTTSRHLR